MNTFEVTSSHGSLVVNSASGEVITLISERSDYLKDILGFNLLEWRAVYGEFPKEDSSHDILDFGDILFDGSITDPCYSWRSERKLLKEE